MKTAKVGPISTQAGWMLVRLEPNLAMKGLNRNFGDLVNHFGLKAFRVKICPTKIENKFIQLINFVSVYSVFRLSFFRFIIILLYYILSLG